MLGCSALNWSTSLRMNGPSPPVKPFQKSSWTFGPSYPFAPLPKLCEPVPGRGSDVPPHPPSRTAAPAVHPRGGGSCAGRAACLGTSRGSTRSVRGFFQMRASKSGSRGTLERTQTNSKGPGIRWREPGISNTTVQRPLRSAVIAATLIRPLLRIVRHVPAGERMFCMATVTFQDACRHYPGADHPAVDSSTSRSGTASSWSSSGRRAAASRPRCGCSPASKRSPTGTILHRRPRRHPHAAQGPRHRDGVPELRALPAHDRRRQHGLRAEDGRRRQGRARQARHEAAELLDLEELPRPQAEGAVRRSAPARRDGPRDRAAARRCSAWTSRCPTSTPSCASRPVPRSPRCSAGSASPPSTSPTTRSRP